MEAAHGIEQLGKGGLGADLLHLRSQVLDEVVDLLGEQGGPPRAAASFGRGVIHALCS